MQLWPPLFSLILTIGESSLIVEISEVQELLMETTGTKKTETCMSVCQEILL